MMVVDKVCPVCGDLYVDGESESHDLCPICEDLAPGKEIKVVSNPCAKCNDDWGF